MNENNNELSAAEKIQLAKEKKLNKKTEIESLYQDAKKELENTLKEIKSVKDLRESFKQKRIDFTKQQRGIVDGVKKEDLDMYKDELTDKFRDTFKLEIEQWKGMGDEVENLNKELKELQTLASVQEKKSKELFYQTDDGLKVLEKEKDELLEQEKMNSYIDVIDKLFSQNGVDQRYGNFGPYKKHNLENLLEDLILCGNFSKVLPGYSYDNFTGLDKSISEEEYQKIFTEYIFTKVLKSDFKKPFEDRGLEKGLKNIISEQIKFMIYLHKNKGKFTEVQNKTSLNDFIVENGEKISTLRNKIGDVFGEVVNGFSNISSEDYIKDYIKNIDYSYLKLSKKEISSINDEIWSDINHLLPKKVDDITFNIDSGYYADSNYFSGFYKKVRDILLSKRMNLLNTVLPRVQKQFNEEENKFISLKKKDLEETINLLRFKINYINYVEDQILSLFNNFNSNSSQGIGKEVAQYIGYLNKIQNFKLKLNQNSNYPTNSVNLETLDRYVQPITLDEKEIVMSSVIKDFYEKIERIIKQLNVDLQEDKSNNN